MAPGAAALAASVVLTSPVLFDALHWISGISDLMCVAGLAAAVWLLTGPATPTRRWLAVVAYALALASKEIGVGAAPVMAVLHLRPAGRAGIVRAIACAALAVLFARALPASGPWPADPESSYALQPAAVLRTLPAFTAAAAMGGTAWAEPGDLAWSRHAWVQGAGWGILAAWLVALIVRRSPAAWLAAAWFAGLLAPVAMLDRQFHLYYLSCALPGFVASVAFLVAGSPAACAPWTGWVVAALVVAQMVAIEARAGSRLPNAPLPTDFVLRRAVIAHHAIDDLRRARETLRPRVVMLGQQPVESAVQGVKTTEVTDYLRDPFWDENVRAALYEGEAIRLMFPVVREVVFARWLVPSDTGSTIAAYHVDGRLTASDYATFVGMGAAPGSAGLEQRLARAGELIQRRLFVEAADELLAAQRLAPDHPDILLNLGTLQAQLGDSTGAIVTLGRALEVSPGDPDARYNLGLLEWRMGRRDAARATWGRLLSEHPESDLARAVRDLEEGRAR
jgi:hypothetical protein